MDIIDQLSDAGPVGSDVWGHDLTLENGDSLKCETCEMERQLPELMQQSTGFREAVYKVYILGQFKRESCDTEVGLEDEFRHDFDDYFKDDPRTTTKGTRTKLPKKGWRVTLDGTEYVYEGAPTHSFHSPSAPGVFTAETLCQKHGKEAVYKLPDPLVEAYKKKLRNTRKRTITDKSTFTTDGGLDPSTGTSTTYGNSLSRTSTDTTVSRSVDEKVTADRLDDDSDSDLSSKERLAKAIQDTKEHFLK